MSDIDQNPNGRPLVSIVVPIYNVERYLPQCVNSLLYQTLKNIEIILVNDGSPDNCPAMCDAYAAEDKRVRVIHQLNGGYGKACNAGFAAAQGEYIGIVESDDYVELDMLEKLYNLAKLHNLDVVRCHFYQYYSLANVHERIDIPFLPKNMIYLPNNNYYTFYQMPAIWSMIYRTDLVRKNNIRFLETPGASFQDTSFAFKIYACTARFMLTDDTFVHYRIDNENSSVRSRGKVFCVCEEYAEIERFAREKNVYEKLRNVIPKIKFACYMWNYKRLDGKSGLSFLKVFSKEMRDHIARKEIKEEFFSPRDTLKVYMIAYGYFLFHIRQYFIKRG